MKILLHVYPLMTMLFVIHSVSISQSSSYSTSSIDSLTSLAKEKFNSGEESEAMSLYEDVLEMDPQNYEALWNSSVLYASEGYRLDDEREQEEKFKKALELAEKAVELHPDKGYSYYAYAVAKGRMTEVLGKRDRIRAAHVIRDNIEKAAELIPEEPLVWHLWGVWHSDVSNVSRAERWVARFISGGLPEASNETAEEYLKKAVELDETSILFRWDLAHHYIAVGEDEKAIEVLEELIHMEPQRKDDPQKIENAKILLDDLR